jgi:hypothetical protein
MLILPDNLIGSINDHLDTPEIYVQFNYAAGLKYFLKFIM